MTGGSLILASAAALAAVSSRLLVAGVVAQDGADPSSIATQGGIFAIAIAVGWFMLNRGDKREKEQATVAATQREADLKALRDEHAILRGELMQTRDQLIESLTSNAKLAAELAAVHQENADLKVRIADYERGAH